MARKKRGLTTTEYDELKSLVGRNLAHTGAYERRRTQLLSRCTYLGGGCGRVAVRVDVEDYEPIVLKFVNMDEDHTLSVDNLDGFSQNRHEVDVYTSRAGGCRYVPRFFDWDDVTWRWIEVELLDIAPDADYDDSCPLAWKERERLSRQLGVRLDELSRGDHWGRDSRGRWKVVDMGS